MIASFSGAHPYRPACVTAEAAKALHNLQRLERHPGELVDPDHAQQRIIDAVATITTRVDTGICPRCTGSLTDGPAGSRITDCRCVPVCPRCGAHEALNTEPVLAWPLERADMEEEMAEWEKDAVLAFVDPAAVAGRPNPGGWLEHGYTDTTDMEEQNR